MNLTCTKIDGANAKITAVITADVINTKAEMVLKNLSRDVKIDGFRKGKVPATLVKARYGAKVAEDARNEAARDAWLEGVKELGIDNSQLIGEPMVVKFENNGDNVNLEIEFSFRPEMNLEGYQSLVPTYEVPAVTEEEVTTRLNDLAKSFAVPTAVTRSLAKGDTASFDFKGSLDGEELPEATATNYQLEMGSGQFIPGFEDQMIGMNPQETKVINVTFPADYHSEKLAGKPVSFEITLHEVLEKNLPAIDDELAKKMLTEKEDATVADVKEKIKETLINEKKSQLFNDELKPALMNAIVEKYAFDLPKAVVRQEVELLMKNKLYTMNEEEIEALRNDSSKVEALRNELEPDAAKSVKATFIVDELARLENITVEDREVMGAIYYEALMRREDPKQVLDYYKDNGLLPAIKMAMIEDKLLARLLDGNKE